MNRVIASAGPTGSRLASALLGLTRGVLRLYRRTARKSGLSLPRLIVLQGLDRTGPAPTTMWAERLGISPSTTTEVIDGLVRAGYVGRGPDPSDRRRVVVALTPRGRRLVRTIQDDNRRTLGEAIGELSPKDLSQAARVIESLERRIGAAVADRPSPVEVGVPGPAARRPPRAARRTAPPKSSRAPAA